MFNTIKAGLFENIFFWGNSEKLMKIVNYDGENLRIFWTTWEISMKLSWKLWPRLPSPPPPHTHTHTPHLFKLFHFVKCQLVFNFTGGPVQAHSDKGSFNLRVIVDLYLLKVMENRK